MLFFWENVTRYPKFFITSVAGLLIIITTPFQRLLKNSSILFIVTLLITIPGLIIILQKMLDI